jgi:hypothetical protein
MKRRNFLKLVGGGAAGAMLLQHKPLWAAAAKTSDEFFIFVHASGGWDVTLWADPRNEKKGIVDPATPENTDIGPVKLWKTATAAGDIDSFQVIEPAGSKLRFGPGIGDLIDLRDRLTIVNGLAMNTVSHTDGTAFSATGRHLAGGRPPASSVDVAIANELGVEQLLPTLAVSFPASFVGERLDRRAIPLRVSTVASIAKSLSRSEAYLGEEDRTEITALLTDEAHQLAKRANYPETYERLAAQTSALPHLLGNELKAAFTQKALQDAYPQFDYKARFQAGGALSAAFAVEAMKRNLVRCIGFAMGGLDTHNQNYKQHAHIQQELFGVIATLVKIMDATPHPTKKNAKLSDHAHVLVFSDFCRTPQINLAGGRDHYPNNSALVLSPRFKGGRSFGATDREQLLPADAKLAFSDGPRPIAPPDLLATFVSAFGIEPRKYLRDGEVVKDMLK